MTIKKPLSRITKFTLLALTLLIAGFCYLFVPNLLKATDPYHPWFNPDKFRFEDYSDHCMKKEVLAKLFPIGTERSFVERVLVDAGHANPEKLPEHVGRGPNAFSYYWESPFWGNWFFPNTWNVTVVYDSNNMVSSVTVPVGAPPGESVHEFYKACQLGKSYGRNWK